MVVHLELFGNYIHRMTEVSRAVKPIDAHLFSEAAKNKKVNFTARINQEVIINRCKIRNKQHLDIHFLVLIEKMIIFYTFSLSLLTIHVLLVLD